MRQPPLPRSCTQALPVSDSHPHARFPGARRISVFLGQAGGLLPCNLIGHPAHHTLRDGAATLPLCRCPAYHTCRLVGRDAVTEGPYVLTAGVRSSD